MCLTLSYMFARVPCRVPPPESERPQLTEYVLDPATGKTLAVNKASHTRSQHACKRTVTVACRHTRSHTHTHASTQAHGVGE